MVDEAQYKHDWYLAHRDEAIQRSREWRLAHPERARAAKRRWAAAHREYYLFHCRARRAKMKTTETDITPKGWAERIAEFGSRCAYCAALVVRPQMDHIDPISRGGSHTMDNVAPACFPCNASKRDLSLLRFLLRRNTKTCEVG